MATTRNFNTIGQWALNADTTIPTTPIEGVAYRDTSFNQAENEVGQEFKEKINSAEWNQGLYTTTGMTSIIDTHGIPGWSDLVDYLGIDTGNYAVVWGSDGKLYQALQASGPSGVGAKDPILEPTYWGIQYTSEDYANKKVEQEGSLLVGYTNQTVKAALDARNTSVIAQIHIDYDPGGTLFFDNGINFVSGTDEGLGQTKLVFSVNIKNQGHTFLTSMGSEDVPPGFTSGFVGINGLADTEEYIIRTDVVRATATLGTPNVTFERANQACQVVVISSII